MSDERRQRQASIYAMCPALLGVLLFGCTEVEGTFEVHGISAGTRILTPTDCESGVRGDSFSRERFPTVTLQVADRKWRIEAFNHAPKGPRVVLDHQTAPAVYLSKSNCSAIDVRVELQARSTGGRAHVEGEITLDCSGLQKERPADAPSSIKGKVRFNDCH